MSSANPGSYYGVVVKWILTAIISLPIILSLVIIKQRYYYPKCPTNVKLVERTSTCGRWVDGLRFLVRGPSIISKHYVSDRHAYAIPTPENYYVMVSSTKHLQELSHAGALSVHATAKEIFGFRYTLGIELSDKSNENASDAFRITKSLLMSSLPSFERALETIVAETLSNEIADSKKADGWTSIPLYPLVRLIVSKMNGLIFYGEELCANSGFSTAAYQFPNDVFIAGELIRFVPSVLAWLLHQVLTSRNRAAKDMMRYLMPVIQDRTQEHKSHVEGTKDKEANLVQWVIDSIPGKKTWTSIRIFQSVVGIWMASVHQIAMSLVNILNDLAIYSEYVEPLRKELTGLQGMNEQSLNALPLLDSFLKESSRLHSFDAITIRRKAIKPYTFSDGGPHIPVGNWACAPLQCILRDEANYQNAQTFDGFRFAPSLLHLDNNASDEENKFTTVAMKFPFWGFGPRSCPGRFYASYVIKLVVVHVLLNYDIKILDSKAPRSWTWRNFSIPFQGSKLMFRRRAALKKETL